MQKVQIQIFGKDALVDSDQVKFLLSKELIVKEAQRLEQLIATLRAGCPQRAAALAQLENVARQIICLNRRIRKNVQFI
jgi:hypothetical protein